jgi:REP element-mobilizing transposase RayT
MRRKHETIAFYRKKLPHWEVCDGVYFITIRQAGTIPPSGIKKLYDLSERLARCPNLEYVAKQRKLFALLETLLTSSNIGNLLNKPYIDIIVEAIKYRHKMEQWHVVEYVIMSNHIHLFLLNKDGDLRKSIKDFKRWTVTQFNSLAAFNKVTWQKEWFDHWSRSSEEDEKIVKYIRNNPVKAKLVDDYRDWAYGGWSSGF